MTDRAISLLKLRVDGGRLAAALAVAGALFALCAVGAKASTRPEVPARVVDIPVSFTVHNVNRTQAACPTDGKTYHVRGHLVAPASALSRRAARRAVTLYIHGSVIGEEIWRFPVSGYDWALKEANAGHASVTIDQMGFGSSGIPDGTQLCVGSWADAAHQVVSELRSGRYQLGSDGGLRFSRIALSGYCVGGLIAQVEAYTFKDVDAFIEMSSAFDQGLSQAATTDFVTNPTGPTQVCARGGEPKFGLGSPGGYSYVLKGSEQTLWLHDAEPRVIERVVADHEREPCAEGPSLASALAADRAHMSEITVPVLLVFGNDDAIFPPPDGQRQKALYSGSHDVKLVQLDDTGHALQLGRRAPAARRAVAQWLSTHGF